MPYRERSVPCPRCAGPLEERMTCAACKGRLVSFAILHETHPALVTVLGEHRSAAPARPIACPTCGAAMRAVLLEEVKIDFCESHGVWFDDGEIEALASGL
jgi:hypothetical protein